MIRVFQINDKNYISNGDIVMQPTKCRIKNADNGDFMLEMTCNTEYNDFLQANNIIVAPTPAGDQAFRIRNITKKDKKLEIKAPHVYYDSNNYLIADSFAVDKTCQQALDHFNAATDTQSPFSMYSDVETVETFRCVRKSLKECIETVLERWGGHLKRNNWEISILSEIGTDNGITIQYKKNLKELTASYDWSKVCTKVLPVGKDGILLNEKYLYSRKQYKIPFTKTVSFNQDINQEDYDTETEYKNALKADLKEQAAEYLKTACYPSVNYTLKGNPEKITDIGDVIEVKDERIGVDIMTQVISYEFDAITQKYISLEFGNFTNTLNNLLANITGSTDATVTKSAHAVTEETNLTIDKALAKSSAQIAAQTDQKIENSATAVIVETDQKIAESAGNVTQQANQAIAETAQGIMEKIGDVSGLETDIKSNLVDAINSLNSSVSNIVSGTERGGVSAVGDGSKTVQTLLNELFAAVEMPKVTQNAKLVIYSSSETWYFDLKRITSSSLVFSASKGVFSRYVFTFTDIQLNASESSYVDYAVSLVGSSPTLITTHNPETPTMTFSVMY